MEKVSFLSLAPEQSPPQKPGENRSQILVDFHLRKWERVPLAKMRSLFVLSLLLVLLSFSNYADGRRGRGKGRKGGLSTNMRVPPGGQWRDPDTAKYYTNPKGAKITKSSHFDLEYILGHKINFLCVAKGSPRPQITWFKDGIELYSHHYLQVHEWREGEERIKSKMEIDPATQMDAGIYECYADNKYAVDKRTFRTDFLTNFD